MREKEMPFWEEAYQNIDSIAFSDEPNSTIKELEYLFNKEWNVLEAGCGEGQNVLYLAKQGYTNIDAFDLSEHGIAKLKRKCELENLRINAFIDDLTIY